jgi:hypothetical protein
MGQDWQAFVDYAIARGGVPFKNRIELIEVRWAEECPDGEKSVVHWAYEVDGRVITGHGQPIDKPTAQSWVRAAV